MQFQNYVHWFYRSADCLASDIFAQMSCTQRRTRPLTLHGHGHGHRHGHGHMDMDTDMDADTYKYVVKK